MVNEHRFVCPAHVIRLARLLHLLIDVGCVNCMLLPKAFELAVVRWLAKCPLRASENDRCESFASRLTTHVQSVFSMLRTLHHEEQKSNIKKSIPFRRKASAADWVVIEGLLERVEPAPAWSSLPGYALSFPDADMVCASATPSIGSPRTDSVASRPQKLAQASECDEYGFPLVFQVAMSGGSSRQDAAACGSSQRSMSLTSAASMASTVFFQDIHWVVGGRLWWVHKPTSGNRGNTMHIIISCYSLISKNLFFYIMAI